ncbi:hypothetical protein [Chryseobacterium gambrini]|uniref:hypothetical protein n=1 Tax=Chryseobacterium gambrini TaxID=373672 RepID=UPI0022F37DFC|nr:hypothetical protein [Chryseobacterium gambrini]WBX97667.1 hypothetical protein PE065_00090 [Chryseobacterium gambrini]
MKKHIMFVLLISSVSLFNSQVGINTANPQGMFHVDGGKDNSTSGIPTQSQQANDFVATASGSVGVGTVAPDASSILDLTSSSKGFLAPRIALTSNTDTTTISSPAVGLLIFNKGTGGLSYVGYIFWNGTEWRTFNGGSLANGTIGSILCDQVALTPETYGLGTPYSGTLTVRYTGGNGGIYAAQSIASTGVTGLTATLASGSFEAGSGVLNYNVTGTPSASSPATAHFAINIGGKSCGVEIGSGLSLGQAKYWYGSMPANVGSGGTNTATVVAANYLSSYNTGVNAVPSIDGMRFDYYAIAPVTGNGTISGIPRLVNISGENIKVSFAAFSTAQNYGTMNKWLSDGQFINLDDGIWNGYGANETTSTVPTSLSTPPTGLTEIETLDIWLNERWYRVTYFPVIDNNNTISAADDIRKVAISVTRLK